MSAKKMFLDVRIVKWFLFVVASFLFFVSGLLLTGLSDIAENYQRFVLFGILSLTSNLSFGIYFFCTGIISVVCGYGISKGFKFGWWCLLVYSIYHFSDILLVFYHHQVNAIIGICIDLGLITWLIYRKRLYGIGKVD